MGRTTITLQQSMVSPVNSIFIIDCLGLSDQKSARRRHEDICDELMALAPLTFEEDRTRVLHCKCADLNELVLLLSVIREYCQKGVLPLLFIDGHGDREKGLKLPSGQFMGWDMYLDLLNHITLATGGELTVIAAFCNSMAIEPMLSLSARLPFSFYYGYASEVPAGLVETETKMIYESLLRDGGQRFGELPLQISSYSEYHHANQLIAHALLLAWAPETLAEVAPELSRGTLRAFYEQRLAANGVPLSGARKNFNKLIRGNGLVSSLVTSGMHDTPRRERYLYEILQQMGS